MSDISYYLKQISIYLIFIVCQVKLSFLFEVNNIKPDLLLLFIILHNMKNELPLLGILTGFLAGFLVDLLMGDVIGISSLTYSIAGFTGALFGRENERMTKSLIFGISISITTFHFLLYYSVTLFGLSFITTLLHIILPSIFYTEIVQVIYIVLFPFKKKRKYI